MIVIATVRADRYEPLQTAPQLAAIQVRPFDDLKPMPQAQFKEVICGPARRAAEAGSRLAIAPELVDRLLDDWSRGADTLPLLSLTLARLYQDYGGGEITLAEYERDGRPAPRCAERSRRAAGGGSRGPATATGYPAVGVRALAGNDQPGQRPTDAPGCPLVRPASRRAIRCWRRSSPGACWCEDERDGEVVVEVALESLLRQWDALAEWLRVEAADLKDADNLERAARAWTQNGCRDEWLLPGQPARRRRIAGCHAGFP